MKPRAFTNNKEGTFSLPEKVASTGHFGGWLDYVRFRLDNLENVHVIYRDVSDEPWNIYYTNNIGDSFSSPLKVTQDEITKRPRWPSLAIDDLGTPHVVNTEWTSDKTYYTTVEGDSFTTPILISSGFGVRTSIVTDNTGTIHIVCRDGSVYAFGNNNSFTSFEILHWRPNVGPRFIDISPDNVIHMVFAMRANQIETDYNWDIYHLSFTASTNTAHIAYGSVYNSDRSVPGNRDITFQAYIKSQSGEVLTEKSAGCRYQNGVWSVQCASLSNQWEIGDTLQIDFTNVLNGESGSDSGILTSASEDDFGETVLSPTVKVEDPQRSQIPAVFALHQNYPNPFNPETTIEYQLPKFSQTTIKIYNIVGQVVKTLVDQKQPAGYYTVNWNGMDAAGRDVASGVYFYRLTAKDFVQTRKMVLVR